MPIRKIFKIWNSSINSNYGYRQARLYKGRLYAFLCKPTWTAYSETEYSIGKEDIEEMFYFEGVFPESDGSDSLQTDISENQLLKLQIQFSYDSYYFGAEHDDILTDGIQKFRDVIGDVQFPKVEDIIPS